ncbi:MAG: hypothetical protein E6356_02685 [Terrisporobacter othiniensis]|uniref:hypothetical protein n=1 Tax=Terrisporobacter petrolearius TaxID=1460447 RepID=UPI0022DF60B0|nr:hypothetical protein [Terrisporobacter petrolearius]MDU4862273.1 hypothetical protein [Terrisporobacter othiniensis]MDU6993727.1 hypothetical protein [Terrisporobacter othiniensis]
MVKKILSYFLSGLLVFNLSTVSYAQIKSSVVHLANIEQLTKQNLTEDEKEKIKKDYNYLRQCAIDVDLIYDIEVNNGKNIYKIEYPNDIKESITIEYKDGAYIMDVDQGNNISNNLVIKNENIFLNGNKIEVERESVVISKEEEDIPMPMADRDYYNTLSCPYGKSSDYYISKGVVKNFNVELTTMIKNITVSVLASILGYYVFIGLTGAVASGVASGLLSSFSGSTSKGLSYKNYIYHHKNGHYIKAIGATVQKNNVRWYEKTNYGGKSKVIPTYTVHKQY